MANPRLPEAGSEPDQRGPIQELRLKTVHNTRNRIGSAIRWLATTVIVGSGLGFGAGQVTQNAYRGMTGYDPEGNGSEKTVEDPEAEIEAARKAAGQEEGSPTVKAPKVEGESEKAKPEKKTWRERAKGGAKKKGAEWEEKGGWRAKAVEKARGTLAKAKDLAGEAKEELAKSEALEKAKKMAGEAAGKATEAAQNSNLMQKLYGKTLAKYKAVVEDLKELRELGDKTAFWAPFLLMLLSTLIFRSILSMLRGSLTKQKDKNVEKDLATVEAKVNELVAVANGIPLKTVEGALSPTELAELKALLTTLQAAREQPPEYS